MRLKPGDIIYQTIFDSKGDLYLHTMHIVTHVNKNVAWYENANKDFSFDPSIGQISAALIDLVIQTNHSYQIFSKTPNLEHAKTLMSQEIQKQLDAEQTRHEQKMCELQQWMQNVKQAKESDLVEEQEREE